MNHNTTKSLAIALLCSVALHLMLAFAPKRTEHAVINNNKGTSELKLTLASKANPVTLSPAPVKEVEEKRTVAKEPTLPKPIQHAIQQPKKPHKPVTAKSPNVKKILTTPKPEKEVSKKILPKEVGSEKTTAEKKIDKPVPQANKQYELSAADSSLESADSTTETPAESLTRNAMKRWQSDLVQRINRQKRYPRQALRRGLEGDVKVKAMIQPDGSLAAAEILSGDKRFKTSSLQAISRALPFPPPVAVSNPITVSFTIHYSIN
ncbi:TonB family protein [Endozoicomonas sp.]|uniref:energy transducer TonB n=1 Tax=Endozoicomonas sp. TaxID=1892382 RepID=UPI0028871240|nr:energy transducer TonB [Endozoicomonas sp.]